MVGPCLRERLTLHRFIFIFTLIFPQAQQVSFAEHGLTGLTKFFVQVNVSRWVGLAYQGY